MSSESIGFLSLPREIRDEIYYLAAVPERPIKLYAKKNEDYCDVSTNCTLSLSPASQRSWYTFFQHVRVSIDFVDYYDASSGFLVPQMHIRRLREIEVEKDHRRLDFILPTVTHRAEISSKLQIEQSLAGSLAVRWTVRYTRGPYRWPTKQIRDELDGLLALLSERNTHVARRLLGAQPDWLAALQCLLNHVDRRWEEDDVVRLIRGTEDVTSTMTSHLASHESDSGEEDQSTSLRPSMLHLPANTTIL
ncbi:hypothetical protein LTR37_001540 [Vermiconidia calcicola]|uniref:Uncharacterized protein n=1 Tax=Vermiconidia calcicola TaxID=1690605 RepID=A0ACC3NV08_9PEZI|nr:hypothetical protein LTR37_001540 [Vermiconidia calcicola]